LPPINIVANRRILPWFRADVAIVTPLFIVGYYFYKPMTCVTASTHADRNVSRWYRWLLASLCASSMAQSGVQLTRPKLPLVQVPVNSAMNPKKNPAITRMHGAFVDRRNPAKSDAQLTR
jgi:hypothetical protein